MKCTFFIQLSCHREDTAKAFHGYSSNFILSTLSSSLSEQSAVNDPRKELHEYLDSPRDATVTNPVKWWGVSSLYCFPASD